jgi:hypothetical protein
MPVFKWLSEMPVKTGWYWVMWMPGDVEEPVHVVVEGASSMWSYDEGMDYLPLAAADCEGALWNYDPEFVYGRGSQTSNSNENATQN